ncbi:MAG: hypothetical protein LH606_12385, partial [Cytophagaceae bacterium]|nr:hypothetical protein [Cytophagaceae bacterium]
PNKKNKLHFLGGGGAARPPRGERKNEDRGESIWGNDLIAKLMPLAIIGFIGYAIWDTFGSMGNQRHIIEQPADIQAMNWDNAKVVKKYAEVTNKRTRLLMELREANGQKELLDFNQETAAFWDKIDVRNRLIKPAGSFDVQVDTYTRDTTLTLRFE